MPSPHGNGVLVPAELCQSLARLAVIGARAVQERDGGLPLAAGLAMVINELGRLTDEPGVRTVVSTAMSDGWVSTAEAAAITGVSWQQVTRLCRRGRLVSRRDGYAWQVDRQSAEDYARRRDVA